MTLPSIVLKGKVIKKSTTMTMTMTFQNFFGIYLNKLLSSVGSPWSGILRWEIYEVCKLLATDVRLYSLGGLLKFEKEKVDFLREQVTEL